MLYTPLPKRVLTRSNTPLTVLQPADGHWKNQTKATKCTGGRLKSLYRHLGGDREEINLALALLTAAVRRGAAAAGQLAEALDFEHRSLQKLGKPPK